MAQLEGQMGHSRASARTAVVQGSRAPHWQLHFDAHPGSMHAPLSHACISHGHVECWCAHHLNRVVVLAQRWPEYKQLDEFQDIPPPQHINLTSRKY